ncbi:hypothetical protein ULG90_20725 [Halopseudomonas pachastrellae]|nr:hypothetical protein ULG90_20725 [Halopseudomonas pachastrellae]
MMIGPISDAFQVHWGLVVGVIACILAQVLVRNVTGFSLQVVGGNVRTARMIGLPVDRLVILTCVLGVPVPVLPACLKWRRCRAVPMRRLSPAMAPAAFWWPLLRGRTAGNHCLRHFARGIEASGSLLQRRLGLPDATTLIWRGFCLPACWPGKH